MESDERNVKENNMQNRNSRSRQNLIEPEDEGPYNYSDPCFSFFFNPHELTIIVLKSSTHFYGPKLTHFA